jgi:hypothetical protein
MIIQRLFSNKTQKALRESVELGRDISKSEYLRSSLERSGLKGKDLIKHVSRRDNRDFQPTGTVHDKINRRSRMIWNSGSSAQKLNNYKRPRNQKLKKKDFEYDHGVINPDKPGHELNMKLIGMGIKK